MKGRKGCYSAGGKVRDIGGVRAPEYGTNKNVMREAHGKTTGIIGMGGVQVDGEAKSGRVDRPRRKMKMASDDDGDEDRGRYATGGRLTAEKRDDLPKRDFALPGRRYPINDKSHGRAALSMVAAHGTPDERAKVRAAVKRKFPGIKQSSDD